MNHARKRDAIPLACDQALGCVHFRQNLETSALHSPVLAANREAHRDPISGCLSENFGMDGRARAARLCRSPQSGSSEPQVAGAHCNTTRISPARVAQMDAQIRAIVVEMIDSFADKGEVDVAWAVGRVYPVRVFMGLMGFPPAMFEQFLDWEWDILHSADFAKMSAALRGVLAYLRSFMAEKQIEPDEHLVSKIVHGTIEGRPVTEEEKIGMIWFLWLGGLDTVAATISQMFRRMVVEPAIQQQLRANPELINSGVEEFLRTQPILSSGRRAKCDFEWHGVRIKAGDNVTCLNPAGNFDPARFANPREFDPTRKGNRHFTFVAGVHLCLGASLARRELRILLEEWFARIPEFRLKPGADTAVFPGLLSIRNLPLVWDVAR